MSFAGLDSNSFEMRAASSSKGVESAIAISMLGIVEV
jgi:hypothetical protein